MCGVHGVKKFRAAKIPVMLTLLLLVAYAALTPHYIYLGPPRHYQEGPDFSDPSLQDPNRDCEPDDWNPWN